MMEASLQRVPQLGALLQTVSPLKRAAMPEKVVDYNSFLASLIHSLWPDKPEARKL